MRLGLIVMWFIFMLLDEGLKPIGEAGPDWYVDEAGITVMAVLMTGAGLWLLVAVPTRRRVRYRLRRHIGRMSVTMRNREWRPFRVG